MPEKPPKASRKRRLAKRVVPASARKRLRPADAWLQNRKRWQRRLIYTLMVILGLCVLHTIVERSFREVENPSYGVSFSQKYAEELGLNWRENYTALLDDLKIRRYRLMSYWDLHEPQQGNFDFNNLDWQMDEAHKRGARVSLAIGMRQPRWPECHKPAWYGDLSYKAQQQAIVTYVETVVKRYRNHPALQSYQLENEAFNTWFGECTAEDYDRERMRTELARVKQLDPEHPVYMSLSNQHGLPTGEPTPDAYGFSVYRTYYFSQLKVVKYYTTYPTPLWFHRLRAWWIHTFKDRPTFMHELQMEPWGPKATRDLTIDEQNRSMSADKVHQNAVFGRKVGMKHIDLWGGEWWYWRKTTLKDPSVWEAVREELQRD